MPRGVGKPTYGSTRAGSGGALSLTLNWRISPAAMAVDYGTWWDGKLQEMNAALGDVGNQALVFMQVSHPWTNRTGAAEAGLSVEVDAAGDQMRLTLNHGVYYGIYLEYRWGGKWGVMAMTVERFADVAMTTMQDILVG